MRTLSMALVVLLALFAVGCTPAGGAEGSAAPPTPLPGATDPSEQPSVTPAETPEAGAPAVPQASHDISDPHFDLGQEILDSESLGKIRYGMTVQEVTAHYGEPEKKGEPEVWAADGMTHREWKYLSGLTIQYVGEGEDLTVHRVEAVSPFTGKTERGACIGCKVEKLVQEYADVIEGGIDGDGTYVVGSPFGGLIFTVENGKIRRIVLGIMAE